MDTQLTTTGTYSGMLTPFEAASLRAYLFGLSLDKCVELQAFLDASESGEAIESSLLEKLYVSEVVSDAVVN